MKTLKFKIRKLKKSQFNILKDFAHYSNNLYNYSLYVAKQFYNQTNKYIGLKQLENEVKQNENYKLLPVHSSQQILRLIDKNFRSFFALLRKKKIGQYTDNINIPKFKKKGSMFNIIFTFQNFRIENNNLMLWSSNKYNKDILKIKRGSGNVFIPFSFKIDGKMKQLIIKPINNGQYFNCYLQYEENKQKKEEIKNNNYLSIDLGLNNLCSCFNSQTGQSFIINGKPLKSYNAYFNKQISKLKSELMLKNKLYWSKRLEKINQKRLWYIDDYFNKVVSYLVKYCQNNNITNLVIGYNETWKKNINIGKVNNQKFVMIPYFILKRKLENKCNEFNINFIQTNESHTSKCSFLDLESVEHQEIYLGKRIRRGLFQSLSGKIINADINGVQIF